MGVVHWTCQVQNSQNLKPHSFRSSEVAGLSSSKKIIFFVLKTDNYPFRWFREDELPAVSILYFVNQCQTKIIDRII